MTNCKYNQITISLTVLKCLFNKLTVKEMGYDTPCWLTNIHTPYKYTNIRIYKGQYLKHRLMYALFVEPVIDGLHCDHLCRIPNCCNPVHIEQVTPKENAFRGESFIPKQVEVTHCPQGHPYDEANTRLWRGHRHCRICSIARATTQFHSKPKPEWCAPNRDNRGLHPRKLRTHCKQGHEWTPENTAYASNTKHPVRVCKTCRKEWYLRWQTRHKLNQPI